MFILFITDKTMSVTDREKAELRNLIINTAKILFLNKGIEYVTIRNIAANIDYSIGTIYLYFKDKNEILLEIVNSGFSILKEYIINSKTTEYPLEELLNIGNSYIRFALENKELYDLMFVIKDPNINIQKDHIDYENDVFKNLENTVKKCIENGYFTDQSSYNIALCMWSLVHGLCTLHIRSHLYIRKHSEIETTVYDTLGAFIQTFRK